MRGHGCTLTPLSRLLNRIVRRKLTELLWHRRRKSTPHADDAHTSGPDKPRRSREVTGNAQVQFGYLDGVGIGTLGPRSASVLGAPTPPRDWDGGLIAIVVADTADMLTGLPPEVIGVALTELPRNVSVPAIDTTTTNPIGWKASPEPPVLRAASGPGTSPDPRVLRRVHHLEDWTSASSDPAMRAGELAAAAATGGDVCVTEGGRELESCLGRELYALMTDAERIKSADDHEREAVSIAMRRAALRDHSLRARAGQVLAAAGLDEPHLPLVSVVVPTRRPHRLPEVVDAVGSQTYPHIELVLGLHGDGFDGAETSAQLGRLQLPARTVSVPADQSLGEVLNAALGVAEGRFIAKFDDDDLYGPHHLWDLVLAAEYSGAALVGKVSEYVYLAGADRTVRRFAGLGERYIDPERSSVAGGAALFCREALEAIGGWRTVGVGEDKALASDIAEHGGQLYRTHGSGYLLVRHGDGHTWAAEDAYFLDQAHSVRLGCDRRFAGIS